MCLCICVCAQFCPILCNPIDWSPVSSLFLCFLKMLFRNRFLWNFPGKNTRADCHFLLRGISLLQGSSLRLLCLLHWRKDSSSLHHPGSPTEAREGNRFLSLWLSCFVWLTFLLLLHYIREILVSIPPRDVTKTWKRISPFSLFSHDQITSSVIFGKLNLQVRNVAMAVYIF